MVAAADVAEAASVCAVSAAVSSCGRREKKREEERGREKKREEERTREKDRKGQKRRGRGRKKKREEESVMFSVSATA